MTNLIQESQCFFEINPQRLHTYYLKFRLFMFGGRQIYQMSSGISGLSPIRDKYTELYLKGEEKRGRKTAGSANNIVLAFREQPFRGKNAFFGAV